MVVRITSSDGLSRVILHLPSFVDVKPAGLIAKTFLIDNTPADFAAGCTPYLKKTKICLLNQIDKSLAGVGPYHSPYALSRVFERPKTFKPRGFKGFAEDVNIWAAGSFSAQNTDCQHFPFGRGRFPFLGPGRNGR
jgi:hypothetical protein